MWLFHRPSINFYPYLFVSLTGLTWAQSLSVETTDIWNADSEVTETKLTQPATHVLRGGKQPSPFLTLPCCLVLLRCFSVGVLRLHVNSSCTPAWWWWVARAGWDGLVHSQVTLELLFLEIKDHASQGVGPSIYVRGKMKSVCFAALQLREWDGSSPPTKKPSRAVAWCHTD